jgi:hypothetical protein
MQSPRWRAVALIPLWLLVGFVAAPVLAQEAGQEAVEDATPPASEEPVDLGTALGGEEVDFGAVDELLIQDSEVLSDPGTYAYDPGARRDPFRSLIKRAADKNDDDSSRPPGAAGALVDELTVQGIFMLPEGPVAQVMSTREDTSFLIRPGDQLWDGEVVSMTLNEVVFKQDTDDPTSLKPFREVVKRLDPSQ